ncbi:hypothetical protein GCM10010916_28550 [Paenibacillus abyssi]|uniref:ABC-2 type transporter transmembrane domain-containing protein n=1 Tax=Paenibacillus abyssi TaxID=1340531 RepID=A0A917FX70_9BACL|nr:hypothetical protein GCM10010916_28550 [Paenibacillus abyssi]
MNKHGKQFAKLFSTHFKMTFREKQVWFWSIFYPVLLMVIFMIIFGGGSSDSFSAKIALVEPQGNPLSQGLKQSFEQVDVFTIMDDQPVSQDQAESWLKDKEIDAVIVLPASVTDTEVGLLMNKESQNSTSAQAINGILNNMVLQANLMGQNAEDQLHVTADYISSGSEKLEYTDFILTGMIALAISQAGLFGMVGMVEMRRNGLLKRLMMTPVSMRLFGISNMAVRFILSAIQIVLLGLIGVVAFKANLDINLLSLLFIFIVGTLSFAGFGFMIAA